MSLPPPRHTPVLLPAMLAAMAPQAGETYLDGTFGEGGYSRALLAAAPCRVLALDRDAGVKAGAEALARAHPQRFRFWLGCFGDMAQALQAMDCERLDGIVLDLGLSSAQLDNAARGFSWRLDGPLDMRMGSGATKAEDGGATTAEDIVRDASVGELARIFRLYGEERRALMLARALVAARAKTPFTRTHALAEFFTRTLGHGGRRHAVQRCFQALRIALNDELGELQRALAQAPSLLNPGGRFVVVSFHSLEDRLVKNRFAELTGTGAAAEQGSRHAPPRLQPPPAGFRLWRKRAVRAEADECAANSRARSARLRAVQKTPLERAA